MQKCFILKLIFTSNCVQPVSQRLAFPQRFIKKKQKEFSTNLLLFYHSLYARGLMLVHAYVNAYVAHITRKNSYIGHLHETVTQVCFSNISLYCPRCFPLQTAVKYFLAFLTRTEVIATTCIPFLNYCSNNISLWKLFLL